MLKGLDISKWQSVGTGDQAADFVIIKATEGVGYTDATCDSHYQRAKSQGKLLGVYHFARPDLGNSAVAEADWFISQVQGYIKEAILVLDFEKSTWNVGWAKQWLDRVAEVTGVKPLIYTSESVVTSYDWSSVSSTYGLWLAHWYNKFNVANPPEATEADFNSNIGSWAFCAIWQYTSSAGKLDRDVAFMSREAWGKYANPNKGIAEQQNVEPIAEPTTQPEPTVEPEPEKPVEEPTVAENAHVDVIIPEPVIEKENVLGLPQKTYEILRWGIWTVLPILGLGIELLNQTWSWGLPVENIKTTLNIIALIIGTVLGISKYNHDKER